MKLIVVTFLSYFFVVFASPLLADNQSCVILVNSPELGNSKTCFQKKSFPNDKFAAVCNAQKQFVGVSVNYSEESCAKPSFASCINAKTPFSTPPENGYDAYYYDANKGAAGVYKKSCLKLGGTWQEN